MTGLRSSLLAVLFAAGRPVTLSELEHLGYPSDALLRELGYLSDELSQGTMGILIERVAGGWRLVVHPQQLAAIDMVLRPTPPRLSRAALEVVALVAYHQPITRPELEALRGRSVEGVLEGLLERGLVEVVGEREALGRPRLFGTTERFLTLFGLESLEDLPPIEEGPTLLLRG